MAHTVGLSLCWGANDWGLQGHVESDQDSFVYLCRFYESCISKDMSTVGLSSSIFLYQLH